MHDDPYEVRGESVRAVAVDSKVSRYRKRFQLCWLDTFGCASVTLSLIVFSVFCSVFTIKLHVNMF